MSKPESLGILLAEDDDADVLLLRRAFKEVELANPLQVVTDGQEAVEFLTNSRAQAADRAPALVILDLKMPRRGGMQVLQWMRQEPVIRNIPVMIFSSSANAAEIEAAYNFGANAYAVKPPSTAERREIARFIKDWLRLIHPPLASVEGFKAAQAQRPSP
jgi:CheY-like chemotaxis protein